MSNILSTTNENDEETPHKKANITSNESGSFEVRNVPKTNDTSSSPVTEEENMDTWLDEKTNELVQQDSEEDFDEIVKSLECAIVEPEPLQIQTETVISLKDIVLEIPDLLEIMPESNADLDTTQYDPEMESDSISTEMSESDNEETEFDNYNDEMSESESDNEVFAFESEDEDFTLHVTTDEDEEVKEPNEIKIISVTSIADFDLEEEPETLNEVLSEEKSVEIQMKKFLMSLNDSEVKQNINKVPPNQSPDKTTKQDV